MHGVFLIRFRFPQRQRHRLWRRQGPRHSDGEAEHPGDFGSQVRKERGATIRPDRGESPDAVRSEPVRERTWLTGARAGMMSVRRRWHVRRYRKAGLAGLCSAQLSLDWCST